jgi:hypothetical protein
MKAVDDTASTGPFQPVKNNVVFNDILTCGESFTLQIVSSLDPVTEGTAAVLSGGFIEFTPGPQCHQPTRTVDVPIVYSVACGQRADTATLFVTVKPLNSPVNVIDRNTQCCLIMPVNIPFDVQRKFKSDSKGSFPNDYIDGFSMPLVGDLNGDGKPEIVALGIDGGTGYQAIGHYIDIFDGQSGDRLIKFNAQWEYNYLMGFPHRAPSNMALIDLDNDGIVEIIACNTITGGVHAYKPIFNGTTITTLNEIWRTGSQLSVPNNATQNKGYKTPYFDWSTFQNGSEDKFCYPHPFVVDLNGDGKAEIIVYNKIYSSEGKLIMSWGGSDAIKASGGGIPPRLPNASEWMSSNYTTIGGYLMRSLANIEDPTTQAKAKTIRNAAMTGRRLSKKVYNNDRDLPLPAIVDIDGDGNQEIITGNRIYKFHFNSMTDHAQNYFCMIDGPEKVDLDIGSGKREAFYLSDGFTRVADIDGDGVLDIIVVTYANTTESKFPVILIYVWDYNNLSQVKAALTYMPYIKEGPFSIPSIADINGKLDGWDGSAYTKKLPEICILAGSAYINRTARRTGIKFHPLTDDIIRAGANGTANANDYSAGWNNNNTTSNARKFNRRIPDVPLPTNNGGNELNGHILALTYDASAAEISDRLALSWAMEVRDRSQSTGITMFDFDNDGAYDLCYRDESHLRVISPAKSGRDYVTLQEDVTTPNTAIMFKTPAMSYTGYEAPVIADINLDGSADILVTVSPSQTHSRAGIEAYQFNGQKWAPAPPVWNQAMYDPRQIREDLKINARPISMLTPYQKNGATIYPYNGSWIQSPIVRDSAEYVPVMRLPNAIITNLKVNVVSASQTLVTLTIFNKGTSSIGALAPITFYNGGLQGLPMNSSPTVEVQKVGVDIFPNEKVTITYELNNKGDFNDKLVWACILANDRTFPAIGYNDCDLSNNYMGALDCPFLKYQITAIPNNILCGNMGSVLMEANIQGNLLNPNDTITYQWYKNDFPVSGATQKSYTVTTHGTYKCYVTAGMCRGFSETEIDVKYQGPLANDDHTYTAKNTPTKIPILDNDRVLNCKPLSVTLLSQPTNGTAILLGDTVLYAPNYNYSGVDEFQYNVNGETDATVRVYVNKLRAFEYYACPGALVTIGQGFDNTPGMIFEWKNAAGSVVGNTRTIQIIKDSTGLPEKWTATATYNGHTYNSVTVTVNPSLNCGGAPVGCAVDGTLIFREDFGGDSIYNPRISSTPFSPNTTELSFSNQNNGTAANTYWLLKSNTFTNANNWQVDFSDHTYKNDINRGYMLMIDADNVQKKYYQYTIMDLCENSRMFFSVWAANLVREGSPLTGDPSLEFEVLDIGDNVIAIFNTSDIPRDSQGQLQWRNYGFSCKVPAGHNALVLRIYNNNTSNSSGNDLVLDDLEIRLCVPPVSIVNYTDTAQICEGTDLELTGKYFDDGSFGSGLGARWEYSQTGDVNDALAWTSMSSMTYSPVDTIERTLIVSNVSVTDQGYYRMAVAKAANSSDMSGLDKYKCRAVSKTVYLKVNVCIYTASDFVSTPRSTSITINVSDNDVTPRYCTPSYTITVPPNHASSVQMSSSGLLSYMPVSGYTGVDSIEYSVSCGSIAKTDKVYIFVYNAMAKEYIACPNASVKMGFSPVNNVTYNWYNAGSGGSTVFSGNLYSITKGSADDIGAWWVEPNYNGTAMARIPVILTASANCGTVTPPDCVQNGTAIFVEDFGGNDPNTPLHRSRGIAAVKGYRYTSSFSGDTVYIITKKNPVPSSQHSWYELTDHTYNNDPVRGYFAGFNATADSGQFYECEIKGLCDGAKLHLSAWLVSLSNVDRPDKANLVFILEDASGNAMVRYNTGNLPDREGVWKNYGFEFSIPAGKSYAKLKIINNGSGANGNTFGLDDIEVHFCTSPVNVSGNKDIVECAGAPFELKASYTDSTYTFNGNRLVAQWYRNTSGNLNDPMAWVHVGKDSTVNGNQITHVFRINSSRLSDAGWYRLAISDSAHINRFCCRAMSDIIRVKVREMAIPSDIRLHVEPSIGTVVLNAYLDSLDYEYKIDWKPYHEFIDSTMGTLGVSGWHIPSVHTYTYDIEAISCGTLTAKTYLHAIDSNYVQTEKIYICKDLESSKSVNMNQILGVAAAGGVWQYLTDTHRVFSDNVFVAPPGSKHAGARFFNTQAAFTEASLYTDYDYEIDKKKFEFEYTNNKGIRKRVALIIWGK